MHPILPTLSLFVLPAFLFAADPLEIPAGSEIKVDPADEHTISVEEGATVVTITSPGGIGRTTLRSADGTWPKRIVLRLRLSGLEHFEIGNGELSLATNVSSSTPPVAHPTHVSPGAGAARLEVENQAPPDHPLSLHIRAVPNEKKEAAIPLDGHFEIEIPQDFLKTKPVALNIRWIDFYR